MGTARYVSWHCHQRGRRAGVGSRGRGLVEEVQERGSICIYGGRDKRADVEKQEEL